MNLQDKIKYQKELRNNIKVLEEELQSVCDDIGKEMLENLELEEGIQKGSYIISKNSSKKFIVDELTVYFDKNSFEPFIVPLVCRVRSNGIERGNVIQSDNYIFDRPTKSNIQVARAIQKIKNFYVIPTPKSIEREIDIQKGYYSPSGVQSFDIIDDDIFNTIMSYKGSVHNFRHKVKYFTVIYTKNDDYYVYVSPEHIDKSVRLTQKKLKELKDMINKGDERILKIDKSLLNNMKFDIWRDYKLVREYADKVLFEHNKKI